MEWYVLNYDFNKRKVEIFNIFRSITFTKGVQELLDNYVTFDDFVEKLKNICFVSHSHYPQFLIKTLVL